MTTFTYLPSAGSQVEVRAKVMPNAFGDGYTQRVGDGLNVMPRKWSLSFLGLTTAVADGIETFLEAHDQGQPFDWTPPIGAAGRWVCEEGWKRTLAGYALSTITTTFTEDFAP